MKDLLLELEVLINKATLDYKNKVWLRYEVYCSQFNKLLVRATSSFKDITITPIEFTSHNNLHNTPSTHDAYNMLADRVRLKEFIDKAYSLFEKLNSFQIDLPSVSSTINTTAAATVPSALEHVELVCNHFCSVVRELRRRSDLGTILEIDTTEDMIYLLKSLLRLYFDAIFEEQTALLIPKEKIVFIAKKTTRNTTDKSLMDDFVQALHYYKQNMGCATLFYFIYDPELRISQPLYLENQLNTLTTESLDVKIFIRPLT